MDLLVPFVKAICSGVEPLKTKEICLFERNEDIFNIFTLNTYIFFAHASLHHEISQNKLKNCKTYLIKVEVPVALDS